MTSVPCGTTAQKGHTCTEEVTVWLEDGRLGGYTAPCNHAQNPYRLVEAARIQAERSGRVALKDHGSDRGVHTTPEQAGSTPAPAEPALAYVPADRGDVAGIITGQKLRMLEEAGFVVMRAADPTKEHGTTCWCREFALPEGHNLLVCKGATDA